MGFNTSLSTFAEIFANLGRTISNGIGKELLPAGSLSRVEIGAGRGNQCLRSAPPVLVNNPSKPPALASCGRSCAGTSVIRR